MTTFSGMVNHLSHLEQMYVVLLLHGSFVTPDNTIYMGQTPGCSWMGITEIGTLLLPTMIGSRITNMIIAKQSGSSPRKTGQERQCEIVPVTLLAWFSRGTELEKWRVTAGIKDRCGANRNRSADTSSIKHDKFVMKDMKFICSLHLYSIDSQHLDLSVANTGYIEWDPMLI